MKTALDADPSRLNADESNFISKIREHGWFGTHVAAEGTAGPFSYSTGFQVAPGVPEVIVVGLPQETAHTMLWEVFTQAKAGLKLEPLKPYDQFIEGLNVYFQPVARRFYADYLGWNGWFYGGEAFDCLQMIWPDQAMRFPWQATFDQRFKGLQPDLSDSNWNGLGTVAS